MVLRGCQRERRSVQSRIRQQAQRSVAGSSPVAAFENEDAVAGSGDDRSILGLRQREDVAAVQTRAELFPVRAAIVGAKDAAVVLVVDHAGIQALGIVAVDQQRLNLALGDALIRRA